MWTSLIVHLVVVCAFRTTPHIVLEKEVLYIYILKGFWSESLLRESRTYHQSIIDAWDAIRTNSAVNGIKGPSFLICLESFDFIKSSGIDYTHCVLLGVTKLLINLCVSSTFSKEEFSIAEYFLVLNLRLIYQDSLVLKVLILSIGKLLS